MVNFGPLVAEILSLVWGTPANFNGFRLGSVTARHLVVGVSPNFGALNRGRHLCSAGRPSRSALAHILVIIITVNIQSTHTAKPFFSRTITTEIGQPQSQSSGKFQPDTWYNQYKQRLVSSNNCLLVIIHTREINQQRILTKTVCHLRTVTQTRDTMWFIIFMNKSLYVTRSLV